MPEKMTTKERVLGIITRRGAVGKTPLLQGSKASSEELKVIVAELERDGKIKSWTYWGRAGTMALYTLPDAKDPRTKEMLEREAPGNGGARPAPQPKKATGTAGASPFAAAIADLEARRSAALDDVKKYDTAIETLRALA